MKKAILSAILFISFVISHATHIVGGNFVIVQTGPNNFNIKVKVYRDCCPNCTTLPTSITVGVYDAVTNVQTNTFTLSTLVLNPITLGDNCYSPTGICVQEGIYSINNVFLNNNVNGYYLQTELFARNNTITNIFDPGNTGMAFYAEIPNPAITSMNSSPDFGPYPSDGYFCVDIQKQLNFSVVDPDGDSLSYSLVEPLASVNSTNGTMPKPYSPITWQSPYSFADIVGGTPVMSCDPITGIVTAAPSALGTFVFAIRIEEFRNGIKIGEVRRDVQYHSLNCITDELPEILLPDTLAIEVGSTGCFDIVVLDEDATDTISIFVTSATFADGATIGMPPVPYSIFPDTTYQFFYTDETTGQPDSVVLASPTLIGNAYYGVGGIGLQYCWQTSCEDIVDSPFILDVEAFSIGCSQDTNFINQTVELYVVPQQPPSQEIYLPDTISLIARGSTCFDLVVLSSDADDTLSIMVTSPSFFQDASLSYPAPVSTNPNMYEFFYWNPSTSSVDSVILEEPDYNMGVYTGIGGVGLTYCWSTGCEDILDNFYNIDVTSFKVGCFGDTTFITESTFIEVDPPVGVQTIVPNVFTPNGDNINDEFKIIGVSNYCYDTLTIQIYDRWGKLVYESSDPEFAWDGKNPKGKDVAEGTYYVIINGIFGDTDVSRRYPITLLRKQD